MLNRILKMLGAMGAGVGVTLITQFLLPPAFIHYYGMNQYGEWLVLSATLAYLSTLNFGITTYATNELTMLHKRGEMSRYREIQGSTLALLLCAACIGLAITASVFFLPLARLLHLSSISPSDACMTAFLLGLQMVVNLVAAYYNNLFMVVEKTHRGLNWSSARRMSGTIVSLPFIMFGFSFSAIAFCQLVVLVIVSLISVYDLRRFMRNLPLGLEGATWKTAKQTLAPSGMFAMIFAQQFLIFQAPVIMLQWILGPEVVVLFTISRTILSTARLVLASLSVSISPEITLSFANKDLKKLLNIFHYSEKVVFSVIPITNLGAFLVSPILLKIWLHKPLLFDLYTYGLMALISGAMSMREHKQYFQYSTNTHKRLALIIFFGNLLMLAVSVPLTQRFGLYGFMYAWLVSEAAQMGLIYYENRKLFHFDPSINLVPVLKLTLVMILSLPLCAGMIHYALQYSIAVVGAIAMAGMAIVAVESYFVFGLKDVWLEFQRRKSRITVSNAQAL